MNKIYTKKQAGFTLIELLLAMGFVSVLLIAIAMTVIQIANIYNRGITLKEVDQSGRSLASELQRSINGSVRFDLSTRYISKPWGGRLCLGQYSYIWNYGADIVSINPSRNVYANAPAGSDIRFVKVIDPNASYCTDTIKPIDPNGATELLSVSEHNLAVHSFNVTTTASSIDLKTGQELYSINFLIGTNDQNALKIDPLTNAKVCKTPGETGSDPTYCSVNQFNIMARAGNADE